MLVPFLHGSQHYMLEKACEICVSRNLLREQVFILGRMSNFKQALALIINKLGDIEEVDVLLEHIVGNLDPLVTHGLEIPCNKKRSEATAQEAVSYYEYDNGDADEDEDDNTSSGDPKLRCILRSTAAS